MKEEKFNKLVTEGHNRRAAIMLKKGSDYDKIEADRLSSFKKVAIIANELEVAGCTTFKGSDIANILLILKQVRDANIRQSGRPVQNESRQDTLDDWHNYIDLKLANEIDEEEGSKGITLTAVFHPNADGLIDLGGGNFCKPEVLEEAIGRYNRANNDSHSS
jgi:hypothetical protein